MYLMIMILNIFFILIPFFLPLVIFLPISSLLFLVFHPHKVMWLQSQYFFHFQL